MNKTLKNLIAAVGALAVLAIAYAAVSYVNSYGKSIQPSSFRSFTASGDGKVTAIPDVAEFSFQVITQGGKDLTTTQTDNTNTTNKVIAFVKSKGVAAADIKTSYYNVDPQYQTYNCYIQPLNSSAPAVSQGTVSSGAASAPGSAPTAIGGSSGSSSGSATSISVCPPSVIVGYTVTQSVDVKMRDFTKISDIMGGVVTNGANQVGSLSFTIDDPTVPQAQARDQAIVKAKAKAEDMAKAGGFKLGRLLNIQDGGFSPYPMYNESVGLSAKAAPAAAPTPTIEPGSQDITDTVTLQYEIK
jgi:uncharacterized protein